MTYKKPKGIDLNYTSETANGSIVHLKWRTQLHIHGEIVDDLVGRKSAIWSYETGKCMKGPFKDMSGFDLLSGTYFYRVTPTTSKVAGVGDPWNLALTFKNGILVKAEHGML